MDQSVLDKPFVRDRAYYELRADVEDFLYREADLLDERRFAEWLELLADDLVYFMPIRHNVKFGEHAEHETTRSGEGLDKTFHGFNVVIGKAW